VLRTLRGYRGTSAARRPVLGGTTAQFAEQLVGTGFFEQLALVFFGLAEEQIGVQDHRLSLLVSCFSSDDLILLR
jgi:hypothetical protein